MRDNEAQTGAGADAYRSCLDSLNAFIPYQYAQWVVEDTNSHDYRVAASIIPAAETGYDIAHRTGVIGQVFRTEQSILAPDVDNHPLYDVFDDTIDWELAFPVFADGKMMAVVNLEGTGCLEAENEVWQRVSDTIYASTHCRPPSSAPRPDSACLVNTRRVVISEGLHDHQPSDTVEVARAIARGGKSTLLVGHYPNLLGCRTPTLAEASQQGLGVSYCYFGVGRRLDLLATGPATQQDVLGNENSWWDSCKGRYAFVLV